VHDAVKMARANGFTEIIVQTSHKKLATFLTEVLKMKQSGSEFLLAV
jgi:D-aminopeptidase